MNFCKFLINYGFFFIERKYVFSRKDLVSFIFVYFSRYIFSGSFQIDVQDQGIGYQCVTVGWRQEFKVGKYYKINFIVRVKFDIIDRFVF